MAHTPKYRFIGAETVGDCQVDSPFWLVPPPEEGTGRHARVVAVTRSEAKPDTVYLQAPNCRPYRMTEAAWSTLKRKSLRMPLRSYGQEIVAHHVCEGLILGADGVLEYWRALDDVSGRDTMDRMDEMTTPNSLIASPPEHRAS